MKNYDEFISQVGEVPDFPKNIYGKVRFSIVAEKIKLPAAAFLFFMFAGMVSFYLNAQKQTLDWDFASEEAVFSQDNNYYALFD